MTKVSPFFPPVLEVFRYDMPHVDLPMGELPDCRVLDGVFGCSVPGKIGGMVRPPVWGDVCTKARFFSYIYIYILLKKFKKSGGQNTLQRFYTLQVARISSINTFHQPLGTAYVCKDINQLLKWRLGHILDKLFFDTNSCGNQHLFLSHFGKISSYHH